MHSSLLSAVELGEGLDVNKTFEINQPLILDVDNDITAPKRTCCGLRKGLPSVRDKCSYIAFEQSEIDKEKRKDVEMENKRASIDFKEMFQQYRERTEMNAPHIYIQVEDTMFLDQNRLVSLECIFYARDNV